MSMIDKKTARTRYDVIACSACGRLYYFDEKNLKFIELSTTHDCFKEMLIDNYFEITKPAKKIPHSVIKDLEKKIKEGFKIPIKRLKD